MTPRGHDVGLRRRVGADGAGEELGVRAQGDMDGGRTAEDAVGRAHHEGGVADHVVGVVERDRRDVDVVAGLVDDRHAVENFVELHAGGVDRRRRRRVVGDCDGRGDDCSPGSITPSGPPAS